MDDYEQWKQELSAKSADELETLIHVYDDAIEDLSNKKHRIDNQLYLLRNQLPTVRRIYNLKMREENAKQQEKTL